MSPTVSRLKIQCPPRTATRLTILAWLLAAGACYSASVTPIPDPRPIVIHSGARIRAEREEMQAVNDWLTRAQQVIQEDPSFLVVSSSTLNEVFPWENFYADRDSANVSVPLGASDGQLVYQVYAFFHIMAERGDLAEWVPEAEDAVGFELERAILSRAADAWVLGRTVFDTQPFGPLDELAWAKTDGYLDAFIFTARPNEFAASRAEWARSDPDAAENYRDWFLETFNREPPGIRTN